MARIDVNFTVEKQILTQTPETYLYTGSQDYFYAIFNVDATWNNVNTIKALFLFFILITIKDKLTESNLDSILETIPIFTASTLISSKIAFI